MKPAWQSLTVAAMAPILMGVLMGADLSGRPPIVEAARSSDHDALRALLAKKVDVNAVEGDGSTALHWASYRDDLEGVDLLLHAGAKVNASNDLGATPLWAASQNGSAPMVAKLLAAGANPNAALLAGETPVMVAARSGYANVLELLLAKGGDPNARGARGQTALMWAVSQKHPEAVKVLLAHGADVEIRSNAWNEVMAVPPHGYLPYNRAIPHGGDTALMFAAREDDVESAKLLVAAGAQVNAADAWGVTATTLAAHSGNDDAVAFLLSKGADPNLAAAGFTALHAAIMRRDEALVSALLDHGANPNVPLQTWTPTRRASHDFNFAPELVGATPFWLASRFTEPEIMRLLLKHGADPLFVHRSEKVVDGRGDQLFPHRKESTTALMAATGMGGGVAWVQTAKSKREALMLEAAKIAVEAGIDVNAVNTNGRNALDAARGLGYDSVVKFLTEKGAKSNAPAAVTPEPRSKDAPFTEPKEPPI
ncbi:MAG TPA: ankyrin repeat domain-containing protein [Bryobacteraceae bacterium]|nr:ankyrin repeat domain-containing protein [Bryobacteraceae bacterium]